MSEGIQQSTVLRVLRAVGAITLLGSAATVLLRDWEALEGTTAYLSLLATTFALTVAGLACSVVLKEAKGARTFLALALFTVPVNFAALGGLFYVTELDAAAVAPSLGIVLASAVVLLPATVVGFLVLARSHFRSLSAALLLGSLLLLAPIRDATFDTLALLLLPGALAAYQFVRLRTSASMRTWEGGLARAVLYFPALILVLRTLIYWEPTALFVAAILASTATTLWLISAYTENRATRGALRIISVPPLVLATLAMILELPTESHWSIVIGTVVLSTLLVGMASLDSEQRKGFLALSAIAAFVGMSCAYIDAQILAVALVSATVGIAIVVIGYGARSAPAFIAGVGLTLLTVTAHLIHVIDSFPHDWFAFALIGALAIVTASVVERHGSRVARRFAQLRARFTERESDAPQMNVVDRKFAEPPVLDPAE